jgi:hypothetical protein
MPAPVLAPIIASVLSWLLRDVIIKFIVFSAVFSVVVFIVPYAVRFLGGFVSPSFIGSALSGIPSAAWFIVYHLRLDIGLPMIVSAYVARFLVRRLPVIG